MDVFRCLQADKHKEPLLPAMCELLYTTHHPVPVKQPDACYPRAEQSRSAALGALPVSSVAFSAGRLRPSAEQSVSA